MWMECSFLFFIWFNLFFSSFPFYLFVSCWLCHPQGTLKSIEGQPLDNQFVLASHSLAVITRPATADKGDCNVQLFSQNGKYRFAVSIFQVICLCIFSIVRLRLCQAPSLTNASGCPVLSIQEGETLHLSIFSGCKLAGNRINYAVTSRSSGHVISWGQEYLVPAASAASIDNNATSHHQPSWAAELNLR